MSAFERTETELSEDARAILAYARKWGEPFARLEITDVAPGAAWDPMSHYPRTMAKVDPIRELLRAGLIEVSGTGVTKAKGRRGGNTYKIYQLVDSPGSLADLLDVLLQQVGMGDHAEAEDTRTEILERFGRP
jgi:arginine/lysine/ornithine decarboxylase